MIRRGFVYEVAPRPGDPKARRFALVLSTDARNQSPAIETVIAVPFTTRVRRLPWRVLFPRGTGGLPAKCEAACELVGQWGKSRFRRVRGGEPSPLGGPVPADYLAEVFDSIKLSLGF